MEAQFTRSQPIRVGDGDSDVGDLRLLARAGARSPTKSPRGARGAGKYLNEKGLKVLAALDKVAARMGATPAQVALAWFKGRPGLAVPIASATTSAQLADLVKAAALSLDAASVAELDAASA